MYMYIPGMKPGVPSTLLPAYFCRLPLSHFLTFCFLDKDRLAIRTKTMSNRLLPLTDSCQSDQGSSDGMEGIGSNCDTPTSSETIDTSGLNPTSTSPPNLKGSNKSSAAESGAGVIKLGMRPTECTAKPWIALLEIECKDVPLLMREGFFRSAETSCPREATCPGPYRHVQPWGIVIYVRGLSLISPTMGLPNGAGNLRLRALS